MRRIIGALLLFTVFLILVIPFIELVGVIKVLMGLGFSIGLTATIVVGLYLVLDEKKGK